MYALELWAHSACLPPHRAPRAQPPSQAPIATPIKRGIIIISDNAMRICAYGGRNIWRPLSAQGLHLPLPSAPYMHKNMAGPPARHSHSQGGWCLCVGFGMRDSLFLRLSLTTHDAPPHTHSRRKNCLGAHRGDAQPPGGSKKRLPGVQY